MCLEWDFKNVSSGDLDLSCEANRCASFFSVAITKINLEEKRV